jgi:autotransporter-associated beta strand protein
VSLGNGRNINKRLDLLPGECQHNLVLANSNNSYGGDSGGTIIDEGALQISGDHALGNVPNAAQVNILFSGNGTLKAGAGSISLNANRGISVDDGVTAALDTNGYGMSLGGVISGSGGALTKTGGGTLSLSGTNTYSGGTTVNGGTLNINGDGALGATSGALSFSGNGTLQVTGNVTLDVGRAISLASGKTATFDVPSGATLTLGKKIATTTNAPGSIAKTSAGTLDLGGFATDMLDTVTLNDGTIQDGTLKAIFTFNLYEGEISASLLDSGTEAQHTRMYKKSSAAHTLVKLSGANNSLPYTTIVNYGNGTLWAAGTLTCLAIDSDSLVVSESDPQSPYADGCVYVSGSMNASQTSHVALPQSCAVSAAAHDASRSYTAGEVILIDVGFDYPVEVVGAPRLELSTGINGRYACYLSGSGTATLTFAYVVQMRDNAADLDYSSTDALDLNGGSIRDFALTDAATVLPVPGEAGSLSANANIAIGTHLYWDPAAIEGAAVWDNNAADTFWHLGSPTGALTAWVNGADAVFGACGDTPGAVVVEDYGDENGPVTARSITFLQDGYVIEGATEDDTLSMSEDGMTLSVEGSGNTATIDCKLVDAALSGGTLWVANDADATLTLTGARTYRGKTTLDSGHLAIPGVTIIATLADLASVPTGYDDYLVVNDIDAADTANWNNGAGFLPIAWIANDFDGGGHVISNLYINRPGTDNAGLFAYAQSKTIHDLGLENVNVTARYCVGGLIGVANNCTIVRCFVRGTAILGLTGTYEENPHGYGYLGGLVGLNYGSEGIVEDCYSTADVTGQVSETDPSPANTGGVGGLIGYTAPGTIVRRCFATGSTTGTYYVGGLIGYVDSGSTTVEDCFATGSVSGVVYAGGLIGYVNAGTVTIARCYATGGVEAVIDAGGLFGYVGAGAAISDSFATGGVTGSSGWFAGYAGSGATFTNCFYLERTGQPSPVLSGVTSATQAQLADAAFSVYQGSTPWDFDGVWVMVDGLPQLRMWVVA